MLVLFLATAVIASVIAELILHEVSKYYEIEWVSLPQAAEPDLAKDVVARLREAQRNLNAR
ncbi:hypothetical protein [Rhizobium tubonense]|uniref:Uncharacterized protein n=1 Tax=Rhizobium tubonense TaxID=484088 RepID=A0A2W4D1G8_9HYPH|nr:hypothetical protein [Rhizobium tubonense]PZM11334.1 hypothetical protein CPY51_21535 [Rhizobium tubonense]